METRSPEHMSMIAGIIYNRLEQGMQLQMDSTREYINDYVTGNPFTGGIHQNTQNYTTPINAPHYPQDQFAVRDLQVIQ